MMRDHVWSPRMADRLARLREEATTDPTKVHLIRSGVEVDGGPVVLTLDVDGSLALRIPVSDSAIEDRRSSTVRVVRTNPDILSVVCLNPTRHAMFLRLTEDLLERLSAGQDPHTAPASVLGDWRSMLAGAPGARLAPNALAGLFAELTVVIEMLRCGGDLTWWTGWSGDHVDLRLPGVAVEVKGTLDADHRRVEIHGLAQLDDPPDGARLLLSLQRLTHSPDGVSVPDLVDQLTTLAPQVEVLECLAAVGYRSEHEEDYRPVRFVVEEAALHRVTSGFPRLTSAHLDDPTLAAIGRVAYELDLAAVDVPQHDRTLEEEFWTATESQGG